MDIRNMKISLCVLYLNSNALETKLADASQANRTIFTITHKL